MPDIGNRRILLRVLLIVALVGGALPTGVGLAQSGPEPVKRGLETRIGSDLKGLFDEHQAYLRGPGVQAFRSKNRMLPVAGGLVTVDVVASGDSAKLLAELQALGLQHGAVAGATVSGRLPVGALSALSGLASVRYARPAYAVTHVGAVTSQGDPAQKSDLARATFGVNGAGVTVGLLSPTATAAVTPASTPTRPAVTYPS